MAQEQHQGNTINELMDSAEASLDRNGVKPRKLTDLDWLRFLHDGPEPDEDEFEEARR